MTRVKWKKEIIGGRKWRGNKLETKRDCKSEKEHVENGGNRSLEIIEIAEKGNEEGRERER